MSMINFLYKEKHDKLIEELVAQDYLILKLDSTGIIEIEELYRKMTKVFPIGIPLSGNVHWDAFLDSCWEGLTEQPKKKIAFIWLGSEAILGEKLSDYVAILTILIDLSRMLTNESPGGYEFSSFILGDQENYR